MKFDTSRLGEWDALPFFSSGLNEIETKLAKSDTPVFPPVRSVFKALERCQPNDCRVIILGQDPYHTAGKADGLAFSIPQEFGGRLDSLGNILKELKGDLGVQRTRTDLSDWAGQGILLLNTALTVPEGKANGHARIGWLQLVGDVLNLLSHSPRAYLLWGAHSQKIAKNVDGTKNLKIETAHPSPLSVHRGFFGARPFSKVNHWLKERGEPEINWVGN